MATLGNIKLQDAASPLMEQLTFFHDHTIMITTLVFYIIAALMVNKSINRY